MNTGRGGRGGGGGNGGGGGGRTNQERGLATIYKESGTAIMIM